MAHAPAFRDAIPLGQVVGALLPSLALDTGDVGDVTVRPLEPGELERFLELDSALGGPGYGPPGRSFLAVAGEGHYRPEWTWVAERADGQVVARAAWWGAPDDACPIALDWFDLVPSASDPGSLDRVAVGAALLRAAHERVRAEGGGLVEYHQFLPADWHDRADVRAEADDRAAAAAAAGLRFFVERLRLEWRRAGSGSGTGVPPGSGRLRFAPAPASDDEMLSLFARIDEGTLDAYTRRDLERDGAQVAARELLDGMLWMPGPRDWWRLATLPSGEPVGIVLPSRNYQSAVIGFVGVLPEHRGRGYAADLLAEGTAVLAAQGEDRIVADTDTGNAPMHAAFERSGYEVTGRRVVMA
jgi:RimJ/RimL family protein N-acetyltransferase